MITVKIKKGVQYCLQAQGYGDCNSQEGKGIIACFASDEDELKLYVWSDINQEDPTHIINLENAREGNRKDN